MAGNYLVLEINVSDSIADLNGKANMTTKGIESVQGCINLLQGIMSGEHAGSVKIVSKNASTTISTSGTGSASNTFNFS